MVTFAVGLSAVGGYMAWWQAAKALEAELDTRVRWVARAAADIGLSASNFALLQPGFEDQRIWTSIHERLRQLRSIVPESYILSETNTALVTSLPADSIPIGARLPQFDLHQPALEEARATGDASSFPFFHPDDGRLVQWGFASLDDQKMVLAVLMPADHLVPLRQLRRNLLLGSAAAAAIATLLAMVLAASVVRPMERLSHVARRIQRAHMDEPVAGEAGHEVGRLAQAMESMRLGILERDEQLRLMLAQVAHEIRNPLGGLELFASAVAETEDPEERARLISRIRTEVAALNGIISDFLAYARPMGKAEHANDVRAPIREAVELVGAEMDDRGGTLDLILPDTPLMALVSSEHVKRATLNLLRNAAQASQHVRLDARIEHAEVVIAVSDDGPGVPHHLRSRVFDPFVTDKEQGAGLGLAIVKKVAESNGGRVELADSSETNGGRGAEFRLYFGSLEDPPSAIMPPE
jgi:signal transduction histidine kinase